MFQGDVSTEDSMYYRHFQERAMGRGEGWVEVPFILPVGSVNGYVVSWVASQDGFSRILELRFQKVIAGLRLLSSSQIFSSCFITLLHLPTLERSFIIYHTGEWSSLRGLIGYFGIHSRTCIKRSVVKFAIFFLLCIVTFTTFQRWSLLSVCGYP